MGDNRTFTALAALMLVASVALPAVTASNEEPDVTTIDPSEHLSDLGQRMMANPSTTEVTSTAFADALLAEPSSLSSLLSSSREHVLGEDAEAAAPRLTAGPLAQEIAAAWADEGQPMSPQAQADLAAQTAELEPHVARALAWLVAGAHQADQLRPDTVEAMSDEQLYDVLSDAFPGDPVDPDADRAQLVGDGPASDLAEHEAAVAALDLDRLLAAHATMSLAVDRATAELQAGDLGPGGEDLAVQAAQPGDIFEETTPYGRIVVSGSASHTYTGPAFAAIDLGGDDRWENRAGAVQADLLGLLGTPLPPSPTSPTFDDWVLEVRDRVHDSHNVSVAIDLAGNDVYDDTTPGTQGFGALGGFGALVDLLGDDTYTAGTFAQGAGFVGGAGFLVDAAGQDAYTITQQGQGFAQDAGAGFLADATGQDTYTSELLAQGTGFSANLVGALVDGSGDDTYSCTGIADFSSFVLPVGLPRPGSVCHATGFGGTGVLVDGEGSDTYDTLASFQAFTLIGTGLLVDLAGDDLYDAGEWSNANGVIGVAAIVDGEGRDRYSSVQSLTVSWLDIYIGSNGEGYVAGAGLLIDGSGNDVYFSDVRKDLFLTQYACGAACSYEGGLGVLADGAGDDSYTSELGQGGTTFGASLLLDEGGSDTYNLLYSSTRGQGFAEGDLAPAGLAVADCSYGILHDAGGQDSYSNPVTDLGTRGDGSYWGQGDYGRGLDGTSGTLSYATQQLPTDLQDLTTRRLCEQLTGL